MSSPWPALPYESWRATCETLHAHTQLLGKLAVALAPPEPQLEHAALRLTARGWETLPLPAPDGSGALAVALDLSQHESVVQHSDGRVRRISLVPDRAVGAVTREVLAAIKDLVGPVHIDPRPQEVPWSAPLDQDDEHATYDPAQVATYFAAATQAALVLAELRAPYRGRSTPVNALVGDVRPGRQPLFRKTGRSTVHRLHHAQLGQRSADRDRLVARRCPVPPLRLLRVRLSGHRRH